MVAIEEAIIRQNGFAPWLPRPDLISGGWEISWLIEINLPDANLAREVRQMLIPGFRFTLKDMSKCFLVVFALITGITGNILRAESPYPIVLVR